MASLCLSQVGDECCLQVIRTMEILNKYCLNNRPVSFQILSDQSNLEAK